MPALPPGRWLKATRQLWEMFWASRIAQLVDREADLPRLHRWIVYSDEWFRAMAAYKRQRVVHGSKGQPVINPAGEMALKLDARLEKMEEKFGLTPLDRMRLGIQFGEARRTLDELNRDMNEDDDDGFAIPAGYEVKK